MNKPTDDFVEVPRWVRLLNSGLWNEGPRPSRRQARMFEAFAMGCGIVLLATMFRVAGAFSLVVGYGLSVSSRIVDTYKAWPTTEISWWQWRPARTVRGTVLDYTFVVAVLVSFFAVVFWLAG